MDDRPFWNLGAAGPDRTALVLAADGREVSYGDLEAQVAAAAARLDRGRGLCLLHAAPTAGFVAMYLALLRAGCPVILAADPDPDKDALVTDRYPVLYRYAAREDRLTADDAAREADLHPDLRVLLSTSGSTGAQKLVRLSGGNVAANAGQIASYLGITADDRAPTSLPLNYSYGMSVLNSYLHAGASLLLTDEAVVSERFWHDMAAHGCTSFAGVPQSFALLERAGHLDADLPRLRYVTQAGGKLAPAKVRQFVELGRRRGWDFVVMYGQTEAAPRIAWLPPDAALDNPGAIGRPVPGGSLSVEDADGRSLPDGEEGELVFRGPNVMMGYAIRPADLARGDETGRLATGDLGFRDESGLFHVTGRRSRFLKIAGKRVGLDEVDAWLTGQGVEGVATGRDDALTVVHVDGPDDLAGRLARHLDVPKGFVGALAVDALPLNQNGKIDLPAALALAEARTVPAPPQPGFGDASADGRRAAILGAFRQQFPDAEIGPATAFRDLGGTSNDFVDMELALEAAGIRLPVNWQGRTVEQLAAPPGAEAAAAGPAMPDHVSARVFCTLLVVLFHVIGSSPGAGLNLPWSHWLHHLNGFFDPLRMPMFAFLAGFAFHETAASPPPFRRFAAGLGQGLLLPTAISVAAFALVSTLLGTPFAVRGPGDAAALLVMPYAHYWFIMALTLILLAAFGLARLAPGALWLPLTAAGLLLVLVPVRIDPNVWAVSNALQLLPVFAAGYLFAAHAVTILAHRTLIGLVAAVLAALLIAWPGLLPPPALFVLSLAMIALCLSAAGWVPGLRLLAPYAFFIYLWHIFGTSASRRAVEAAGGEALALHLAAGLAAGVLLPVALYHAAGLLPAPVRRAVRGR